MDHADDRFRLHAYVDHELTPDEVADVERRLVDDPAAIAEVAALRAQKRALHARYDAFATSRPGDRDGRATRRGGRHDGPRRGPVLAALSLVTVLVTGLVGGAVGWTARGRSDARAVVSAAAPAVVASGLHGGASPAAERRLQAFVQTAALSHAAFVPEVRHPVEVHASDEAHLVAWLSKRLDAPLVVPHLADAGWTLLGGRLLPAAAGPVAQFMYEDAGHRRLTLAVSRGAAGGAPPGPAASGTASFRIADEDGATVFYWIEDDFAYALTGRLSRAELDAIATRVYRALDRPAKR